MRRAILAVLLLSLVLPAMAGRATCCDLILDLLFPGSTPTFEEQAHIDRQNANFARREDIIQAEQEHPSHVWQPR